MCKISLKFISGKPVKTKNLVNFKMVFSYGTQLQNLEPKSFDQCRTRLVHLLLKFLAPRMILSERCLYLRFLRDKIRHRFLPSTPKCMSWWQWVPKTRRSGGIALRRMWTASLRQKWRPLHNSLRTQALVPCRFEVRLLNSGVQWATPLIDCNHLKVWDFFGCDGENWFEKTVSPIFNMGYDLLFFRWRQNGWFLQWRRFGWRRIQWKYWGGKEYILKCFDNLGVVSFLVKIYKYIATGSYEVLSQRLNYV